MKTVCSKCGTDNIHQKATIYLNPNDLEAELNWNSVIWEDNYWCMECEDECATTDLYTITKLKDTKEETESDHIEELNKGYNQDRI